jgi:arginine decarboxylase
MARADGSEGQPCTAGIAFARLYNKKTKEKENFIVVEITGGYTDEEIRWRLKESLKEVYNNGFSCFKMGKPKMHVQSFIPQKRFGCAIVALCFTNYIELEKEEKK